jgi:hypothetical protein
MSAWWFVLIVPVGALALFVLVGVGVSYLRSLRQPLRSMYWRDWSREEQRRIQGDDPDAY